ncbi:MAG: sugar phosphate isomerase/epimerase [Bacteroidota bacterium]
MDRRSFLSSSAAALGGLALLGPAAAARARLGIPPDVPAQIGVQLYTVRSVFEGDFVGVLEAIRDLGYEQVEFADYATDHGGYGGFYDREPSVVRAVLDDIGLTTPSTHVAIQRLRQDGGLDTILEMAQLVGFEYVIVPWLDPPDRPTSVDGWRALGEELNGYGARAAQAGVRLGYHNHAFEFDTFGGDTPGYDGLVEGTDPAVVDLEMDLYWVVHAGYDPLDYFARYPGRFPLFHVKDRSADGAMQPVGEGIIDFAAIFAQAEQAGLRYAFVEHDNPTDALASIETSIAHVERLRG